MPKLLPLLNKDLMSSCIATLTELPFQFKVLPSKSAPPMPMATYSTDFDPRLAEDAAKRGVIRSLQAGLVDGFAAGSILQRSQGRLTRSWTMVQRPSRVSARISYVALHCILRSHSPQRPSNGAARSTLTPSLSIGMLRFALQLLLRLG